VSACERVRVRERKRDCMRWCLFVLVRVRLVHGRTARRVFSQIPSIRDPVPLSASSRRGRRLATRTSDATRAFSCPPRAYWRIHGGGQCLNATHGRCATPVSPLETRSDSRRGCRRVRTLEGAEAARTPRAGRAQHGVGPYIHTHAMQARAAGAPCARSKGAGRACRRPVVVFSGVGLFR
jgi:hypothetical protein